MLQNVQKEIQKRPKVKSEVKMAKISYREQQKNKKLFDFEEKEDTKNEEEKDDSIN